MGTDNVAQRITEELQRKLATMSADLDRVEILAAALIGFSRPVPEYESAFHHVHPTTLREHEL